MRSTTVALALYGAGILATSCAHDWDDYDPRLGGGGSVPASSTSSDATTGPTTSDASVSSSAGPGSTSGQSSGGDGGNGGSGGAGPSVSSGGGSTSESSSTGTPTETLEIAAVEADCIDPNDPDPDVCDLAAADDAFTADAEADPPADSWIGYFRFAPGGELAGKTVDSVKLRMHVSSEDRSDSDSSGIIWEAEPFDRGDLFGDVPFFLGDEPVGASVGAVALGEEVTFDIVGLSVAADTPIFLALEQQLVDGVDYLDERSATPPTLIVTYH